MTQVNYYFRQLISRAGALLSADKNLGLLQRVRADGLTDLEHTALNDLYQRVKHAPTGAIVEAGCALGGSAIVMAAAKDHDRPFYIFDAFGMIPPPSEQDEADAHERYENIVTGNAQGIRGEVYYGYQEDLLSKVITSFKQYDLEPDSHNVQFVKGFYEDALHIDEPVAVAHIDCDWYDSVIVCLERITPYLVEGGVLVIDDYEAWSGCKKAVDDFFAGRQNEFEFVNKSRLHIIRK